MTRLRQFVYFLALLPCSESLGQRVFQREPFDRITLTEAAGGGSFDVRPVQFPDGTVPADPKPEAKLVVETFEPAAKAEVTWGNIALFQQFSDLILVEVNALVADKRFEDAYDSLAFLHKNYPRARGLAAATETYLYRNAGALFQQGELAQALAVLDGLHQRNSEFTGLAPALASVSNRLIGDLVSQQAYASARRLIDHTATRDGEDGTTATRWRTKLKLMATQHLSAARQEFTRKQLREARNQATIAKQIWPSVEGADGLLQEIDRLHPMVIVSRGSLPGAIAGPIGLHPDAIRAAELTTRPLVHLEGYDARGPIHASAWGELILASDRMSVELRTDRANRQSTSATGYDVARRLFATKLSDAAPRQSHSDFVTSIEVQRVFNARIRFLRGHVSPLSLLSRRAPREDEDGPFRVEVGEDEIRYVRNTAGAAVQEIIELSLNDPKLEIAALRRGDIDVVARVVPSDLRLLADETNCSLHPYAIPTTHVLLPNGARPYPANQTFRRAIAYLLDRENIFSREILDGQDVSGCMIISGPFPKSPSGDDFWGHAYDPSISPLPYDPRLGVTLTRVSQQEVAQAAASAQRDAPVLNKITIGHEPVWLHRQGATAIAQSLSRLGLACQSLELESAEDLSGCDFVYAELLMREPVVDAGLLLADDRLPDSGGYLALALRELASATNWRDADEQLHKIHAAVHAQQTIIPLWQTTNFYAVRSNLSGVTAPGGGAPISLYQNVSGWKKDSAGASP